jgi:hypothetical protein
LCGSERRCTNLDVSERVDAIAGVELAVAVHQLEELDVLQRPVFEFRHRLVEDRFHGVEAVRIVVVFFL